MSESTPVDWMNRLVKRWHESGAPPSELNEAIRIKNEIEAMTAEIQRLNGLIDWWRGRYNDVVETITDAAKGKEVDTSDNREYPFSNGAKAIIVHVHSQSAEATLLKAEASSALVALNNGMYELARWHLGEIGTVSGRQEP